MMLQEIDDVEEPYLIQELFKPHPDDPDKYKWLDVTTVLVAWDNIAASRKRDIQAVRQLDKMLRALPDDPDELVNERLRRRERLVRRLPPHVVESARLSLSPPVEYREELVREISSPPGSLKNLGDFLDRP